MTFTRFMDMHSGGGLKEEQQYIVIEAPEEEAKRIFYARFGHNPERVSCTCCGEDYSIDEGPTLAEVTAYDRGLRYIKPSWAAEIPWRSMTPEQRQQQNDESRYLEPGEALPDGFDFDLSLPSRKQELTVDQLFEKPDWLLISADEITADERGVDVPAQGYVWVDG